MYLVNTPKWLQWYCPSCHWKVGQTDRTVFLSFDDGPDAGATPDVIKLLDGYDAKATFFCVGRNAVSQPGIMNELRSQGHGIGNHSYSHVKGNKVSMAGYISDVAKAGEILKTKLFRPPYGRITRKQVRALSREYQIVMWTVLTGDFDKNASKETVLRRSVKYTKNGDIIVFHDNKKFRQKMLYALEGFMDHFSQKGFRFDVLTPEKLLRSE